MQRLWGLSASSSLIVLITLMAASADGRPRGSKAGGKAEGKASGSSAKVVHLLKQALEIVHKAPHDYDGHRTQAAHNIEHAITKLEAAGSPNSSSGKGAKGAKGGKGAKGSKAGGTKNQGKAGGKQSGSGTQQAVEHIDQAIHHLQEGIKFHKTQLAAGKAAKGGKGGLEWALKLVTEAKKLAHKK